MIAVLLVCDATGNRSVYVPGLLRAKMLGYERSKDRRDAVVYPRGVAKRAVDVFSCRPGVAKKTHRMMPRPMKGLA